VLWPNVDGAEVKIAEKDEGRKLRSDAVDSIFCFAELREDPGLEPTDASRLTLKEYKAMVSCGLTWIDDALIVTNYIPRTTHLTCPGLVLRTAPRFFSVPGSWWKAREYSLARTYTNMYNDLCSTKCSTVISPARLKALRDNRWKYDSALKSETEFRSDTSSESAHDQREGVGTADG
jgi:hypothetical protein